MVKFIVLTRQIFYSFAPQLNASQLNVNELICLNSVYIHDYSRKRTKNRDVRRARSLSKDVDANNDVRNFVGLIQARPGNDSFDDPHVAPYWPTWPCSGVIMNIHRI